MDMQSMNSHCINILNNKSLPIPEGSQGEKDGEKIFTRA